MKKWELTKIEFIKKRVNHKPCDTSSPNITTLDTTHSFNNNSNNFIFNGDCQLLNNIKIKQP